MRSKWKGPATFYSESTSRSKNVTPNMIGKTYKVDAGNKIIEIVITEDMLGHKLGEFTRTRADYIFKKKKK